MEEKVAGRKKGKRERGGKSERDRKAMAADRRRKLNNQTFPVGFQGILWESTTPSVRRWRRWCGVNGGGEVTGKNQKNKR